MAYVVQNGRPYIRLTLGNGTFYLQDGAVRKEDGTVITQALMHAWAGSGSPTWAELQAEIARLSPAARASVGL